MSKNTVHNRNVSHADAASIAIDDDPFIQTLQKSLPPGVKDSFSNEQLQGLKTAFSKKQWALHPLDVRSSIGLWRWRFYFVFLAGRDRRVMSQRRYKFLRGTVIAFLACYLLSSTLLGILALYLIKSAMGYNLIPGFSFGIWDWFQNLACNG
jgi:hypothetical protein